MTWSVGVQIADKPHTARFILIKIGSGACAQELRPVVKDVVPCTCMTPSIRADCKWAVHR